ncbi:MULTISPECIES: tRNA-uridine aminocarboxypropyltransferase [unclassified Pseudomonas]|uniref:tRNA-uridine aminocarboxypropyltransferase n=1 Tax=unclassified Pseudomonas TaxID=196821 RepID=UPI0008E1DC19|nr:MULTISPECIES: DTW domain-containing protein [unclassified Pseudomonas]PMV23522.1 DTW domain-containing protein [Pseudomonas sp. FW305-3-2-15-C-TSA2]PMV30903.1 DTW domain-containing protein [Pseudomonas sp. DP16D-L5]PMV39497.1 DTW domain-containing protein [Pseudomonas sp. FW305-3-2-15-A-LB2]PMV45372.1 DTW domain-containing protein [Pseudomonas sp. FW305-3-2-15-C-R2A1]PMV52146.1 DTW domain-containing protein [Pseudomonas sp. FW305-3-2-15-C-LB1]
MSRSQCSRCLRPATHCLCPLIPSLESRTRVLLLQHPSEVNHALNTARLAALGLNNAQLVVGEVFDDLATLLNPPGYQARLLFPSDDAQPLQRYAPDEQPMLLVVPDGTWRKARKLLYLNPLLAALPRVTLMGDAVSRYRLRKAPGPGALSTVEAIAQALQVLEAPASFELLLRPFDALIERQIAAMGAAVFEKNHG